MGSSDCSSAKSIYWRVAIELFSPSPKRQPQQHGTALTGSDDRTARIWEAATGNLLGEPMRHDDAIDAVAFSPNGSKVLTGSDDKTARLWDVPQLLDNFELILNWAETKTDMALDDHGLLHRLSQAEWLEARDKLEKLRGNQKLP